MNIVILNGSARVKGSTFAITQAFRKAATSAGHKVKVLEVGRMKISGCLACEYCHIRGNGSCIVKDFGKNVIEAIVECDMVVIASPIYYCALSSQISAAIQRCYALGKNTKLKSAALFLTSASPDVYDGAIYTYQKGIVEYFNIKDEGIFTFNEKEYPAKDHLDDIEQFITSLPLE